MYHSRATATFKEALSKLYAFKIKQKLGDIVS